MKFTLPLIAASLFALASADMQLAPRASGVYHHAPAKVPKPHRAHHGHPSAVPSKPGKGGLPTDGSVSGHYEPKPVAEKPVPSGALHKGKKHRKHHKKPKAAKDVSYSGHDEPKIKTDKPVVGGTPKSGKPKAHKTHKAHKSGPSKLPTDGSVSGHYEPKPHAHGTKPHGAKPHRPSASPVWRE